MPSRACPAMLASATVARRAPCSNRASAAATWASAESPTAGSTIATARPVRPPPHGFSRGWLGSRIVDAGAAPGQPPGGPRSRGPGADHRDVSVRHDSKIPAMSHPLVLALFPTAPAAAAGARALHGLGIAREQISVVSRNHDEAGALAEQMDASPGADIEDSRPAARLGELGRAGPRGDGAGDAGHRADRRRRADVRGSRRSGRARGRRRRLGAGRAGLPSRAAAGAAAGGRGRSRAARCSRQDRRRDGGRRGASGERRVADAVCDLARLRRSAGPPGLGRPCQVRRKASIRPPPSSNRGDARSSSRLQSVTISKALLLHLAHRSGVSDNGFGGTTFPISDGSFRGRESQRSLSHRPGARIGRRARNASAGRSASR